MSKKKVSVYGLKRPESKGETIVVTDEANPGVEITFILEDPDIPTLLQISESIDHYTTFYLRPVEGTTEIPSLPLVDEKPIDLSEQLVQIICAIMSLQSDKMDKYTFEELAVLIVTMPTGMLRVMSYAQHAAEKLNRLLENPTQAPITQQQELMGMHLTDHLGWTF